MNKRKTLFLGVIFLGIGFIIWALSSMPKQPDFSINAISGIELNRLEGKSFKKPNDQVVEVVKSNDNEVLAKELKDNEALGKELKDNEVLAKEPNDDLDSSTDKSLYPVYPVEGENIGNLIIPVLNVELPIFQGTSEKELKKGVGHFIQSVLPGEKDNSVLSGHRETAFRKLGDLVIGDLLIVETSAGTFIYEVSGTRIVDKDDKTVIVPTENAVLTISTCYPFYYVGSAPDRYIVSADLLID